jgi:hypothetical protein
MHTGVADRQKGFRADSGMVLGKPSKEGERPVREIESDRGGTRVPRDTGNPVGSRGDHPPRLNTVSDR